MTRQPLCARAPRCGPRSGAAPLSALFWLLGFTILALPFLAGDRDRPSPEDEDWAREAQRKAFEERYADEGKTFPDIPFAQDVDTFEQEFELELGAHIAAASEQYFARDSQLLRDAGLFELTRLDAGERAYATHCIGCHGSIGDGAGPAARYLAPRPRNFRKGLFKFTSTEAGARPRRADLFRTLTAGLVGSAMPNFKLLPEGTRHDLVEYVRWLGARGEFEQLMLDLAWEDEELSDAAEVAEIIYRRWHPEHLRPIYPGAAEPAVDPASVERGRAIFSDNARGNCLTCHGAEGKGDGPTAGDYLDDWGYPIRPRNLQSGVYRAGSESADLYRTIAAGIKGTPMPSYAGALTAEEMWDLVHFVQSLAQRPQEKR